MTLLFIFDLRFLVKLPSKWQNPIYGPQLNKIFRNCLKGAIELNVRVLVEESSHLIRKKVTTVLLPLITENKNGQQRLTLPTYHRIR